MVGLAFTMAEPYPGESRIVNMIKSCCVHNGGRTWCDFSGPLAGGVPCGEGTESKVGGTTGFCCMFFLAIQMCSIRRASGARFQGVVLQSETCVAKVNTCTEFML